MNCIESIDQFERTYILTNLSLPGHVYTISLHFYILFISFLSLECGIFHIYIYSHTHIYIHFICIYKIYMYKYKIVYMYNTKHRSEVYIYIYMLHVNMYKQTSLSYSNLSRKCLFSHRYICYFYVFCRCLFDEAEEVPLLSLFCWEFSSRMDTGFCQMCLLYLLI